MSESAGGRIAHYRRRRGLSQAALAGLVGRSESWLSQVERGLRAVDRLSVLVELAKVLRVDVGVLTGEPLLPEWTTRFRRLVRRYEREASHFTGFLRLACALISYRRADRLNLFTSNNPN